MTAEPTKLEYWRSRLAVQAHGDSPHVGLTTEQFGAILDELEAARELIRCVFQCRLNNGNGTICRSCFERARDTSKATSEGGTA